MNKSSNLLKQDIIFIHRFSKPLRTFAAVIAILIMITGLTGNLLTIIALCKYPKVRNVAAAFIIRYTIIKHKIISIFYPLSIIRKNLLHQIKKNR